MNTANIPQIIHEPDCWPVVATLALSRLRMDFFFAARCDQLANAGLYRIKTLAAMLKRNPSLCVNLHGHADPRGTDEYNTVLSEYRTVSVQQALEDEGIELERIVRYAHGDNRSIARFTNETDYAWERRVSVEIFLGAANG